MRSTHHDGGQASWGPEAAKMKMPPGPTVNLSAVSGTLTGAGATPPGYSTASSPFARGSSTHSSPYISRTGSGTSDGSMAGAAAGHLQPQQHEGGGGMAPGAAAATGVGGGGHPGDLAAAALQALSRQASLAAAAAMAGGSPAGSRSVSPPGTSTPRLSNGRSNLGPQQQAAAQAGAGGILHETFSVEAALQGLAISGAASPAASGPINFHAPPSGALPQQPPVEVFARFPQEVAGFSGRPAHTGRGHNGTAARHGSQAPAYGPAAGFAPMGGAAAAAAAGYAGYGAQAAGVRPGNGNGGNGGGYAPQQPAFFVGSPPGGYGMPMYPGQAAAVPPPAATTTGFPAAAYYPPALSPSQQHQAYMMHPYYGMMPQPFPQYGVYPTPGMVGGRGQGGGNGAAANNKAAYEAAEYAWQYQAMMSYMQVPQGFGMMVSPSGSPERMARMAPQPGFRRNGGGPERRDEGWRARMAGRPSRLSLDMSASKSENGDAHKLDPQLLPLVAEDKAELQSELLEEYKATREARQWSLQDIQGQLYPFCRDQHGSRLVQQQLEAADPQLLSELFGEIRHKLLPLMVDVFGNYVVQRFLERGGVDVQQAVAEAIRDRALPLSLQMYGCRVVQKALELLPQAERVSICSELTEHTLRCVRDQNGNHVVQKCVECVQPSDPARPMIEIIVDKCQLLATHTFGCRLVQRVLEHCSIAELRERVITEVLGNVLHLAHDQYGNYVVQHLVTKGPEPARDTIVGQVAPQVMTLAQHKYASNVVEACLKHGRQQHRDAIIQQMIADAAVRPTALTALMRDQFGNYVVQRALEVSVRQQRAALLQAIAPHLDQLKKYTYGKHIAAKVEQMLAVLQQQVQAQQGAEAGTAAAAPLAAAPAGPEQEA